MAIYIERVVNTRIYRDSTKADVLYAPRDVATATAKISSLTKRTCFDVSIAAASTEAIGLGDIGTVKSIQLEIGGNVVVTLNGTIVLPLVLIDTATGRKVVLCLDIAVTSISIQNAGAAAVAGELVLIGDPAA